MQSQKIFVVEFKIAVQIEKMQNFKKNVKWHKQRSKNAAKIRI